MGSSAPSTNLADLLLRHPFASGDDLLHDANRSVTAGDARARAREIASALRDAGVQPRQPVAVCLEDGIDTVLTMFAVWVADAVFVPVNPRAPESESEDIVRAVRPAAVVTGDGTTVTRRDDPATHEPDAAFVLWTSGTTGRPKPILHTHGAYVELLDRVLGNLRGATPSRHAAPTPNLIPVALTLNAGIYNVLFGLRAGAAIVVMNRFDTRTFADLVRRFGIRSTVLPPAAMTMLSDDAGVTDLEPLRYVRSITAPLSPVQARRFVDRFGVTVLNGYGQAEIGEVIGWTAADAKEHPEKLGAVGRPHPGVEVRIVDERGAPLGPDDVGELAVRPPNMASGYADGSSLAERVDGEGFLRTGDLARVDAEGFVWIEGRVGDVINRGGNKVFPDQVEEVLRLAPGVRDVAVVGAPDARLGEVPVAFVVGDADDATLERVCREHLVAYKVPVAYHHVDALPRSDVGKVLRRDLAARLAGMHA